MTQNFGSLTEVEFVCPSCDNEISLTRQDLSGDRVCTQCKTLYPGKPYFIDLNPTSNKRTSEHYARQWGEELGFLNFIRKKSKAKSVMPAARLGWDDLFSEIRDIAEKKHVSVYDAACGFGGLANELITPETYTNLQYVGADIHTSLSSISETIPYFGKCGTLVRWDISKPLPTNHLFDYVLCRASLHHTPKPEESFRALCQSIKPGGKIAFSVYNKKGICREGLDDILRKKISAMSVDEAFQICKEFTDLSKSLQKIDQLIEIEHDLPFLSIKKGSYSIHELIYYNIMKCFYNDEFGDEYSTLVNYDWYHPEFAFRYKYSEIEDWIKTQQLTILASKSIDVQHFFLCQKDLD